MKSFFSASVTKARAAARPGLESMEGVNPAARVPQQPPVPEKPGFRETGTTGEDPKDKQFGQVAPFAEGERDLTVIADAQAAMEALHSAIITGSRLAAGLEEMADQLDAMVAPVDDGEGGEIAPGADAGLSPEAAAVLQTSLNATSDVEGAGDVIAVESFHFDRRGSTKALAGKLRARAHAAQNAVDKLRAKAGV